MFFLSILRFRITSDLIKMDFFETLNLICASSNKKFFEFRMLQTKFLNNTFKPFFFMTSEKKMSKINESFPIHKFHIFPNKVCWSIWTANEFENKQLNDFFSIRQNKLMTNSSSRWFETLIEGKLPLTIYMLQNWMMVHEKQIRDCFNKYFRVQQIRYRLITKTCS